MSEFIRLQANGVDAYPDASTENTYRSNGTSVESALLALESNVNTLGGVAGEAKTLAEQNSVKIATAEQEISDINSSLNDVSTWESVSIENPSSGTLIEGSIARINRTLKLGYFLIQVNDNSDNTTIKLGMTKEGSIGLPFYGYDDYNKKQCDCVMYEDTIYIAKANPVVKMFLLFPVSI